MKLSDILKALADESRLKIIKLMVGRELCVCDIIENLQLSQPTISHHLKILKQSGIITDEKRGKWIFYTLNKKNIDLLMEALNTLFEKKEENIKYCNSDCDGERRG